MRFWLGAMVLMGCGTNQDEAEVAPLSLSEVLGPDEVRAGVVNTPEELFGGISAEGRVGDIKIYNDRVRFVIQAVRFAVVRLQSSHLKLRALIRILLVGQPFHLNRPYLISTTAKGTRWRLRHLVQLSGELLWLYMQ